MRSTCILKQDNVKEIKSEREKSKRPGIPGIFEFESNITLRNANEKDWNSALFTKQMASIMNFRFCVTSLNKRANQILLLSYGIFAALYNHKKNYLELIEFKIRHQIKSNFEKQFNEHSSWWFLRNQLQHLNLKRSKQSEREHWIRFVFSVWFVFSCDHQNWLSGWARVETK